MLTAVNALIQGAASAAPWFWPLLVVALGLVMGSFLGCAVYRVPRGLSLRQPPSFCPHCQTRLGVLDLVPVFSWLLSGRRCRHCGTSVSGAYAAIEALTATLFLLAYLLTGPQLLWLPLAAFVCCVVFITIVWRKNHILANKTLVFSLFCLLLVVCLWR